MSRSVERTPPSDDALSRVARRLGGAARRVVGLAAAPSALFRSAASRARGLKWPFAGRPAPAAPKQRPPRAGAPEPLGDAAGTGVPDLAALASDEGLQSLARALSDPDPHVRALALEVVCEFSGARAARLLGGMLQDPEPTVRRAAASAATRVKTSAVVFSLILALQDVDAAVRSSAAAAIQSITARRIDPATLDDPARLEQAVGELKTWWKDRRLAELASSAGELPPDER